MRLRLGGVPEHFNFMWHLPVARELMRKYGVVYSWTDFPGGTGAMCSALEAKELDMAIMLTEGAISAISEGKEFKILFPFVMSPLFWGVFISAKRDRPLPLAFQNAKFAISRLQSGSHLMAKYLSQRDGSNLSQQNFVICNDLKGARDAINSEQADYFLWEKYMTRPLVRVGEFREIDEVSAPWPAFVFVVNSGFDILETESWKQAVYELTSNYLLETRQEIISGIISAFDLSKNDAENWLDEVKYYDCNNYWVDRITAAVIIMHNKEMIVRMPELEEMLIS